MTAIYRTGTDISTRTSKVRVQDLDLDLLWSRSTKYRTVLDLDRASTRTKLGPIESKSY